MSSEIAGRGRADTPPLDARPSPAQIALAGLVALAVAMGIGRFAFTPILPMMLADGSVDLTGGSWLATANYFGYLVGALLCAVAPRLLPRRRHGAALDAATLVRGGLIATGLLTAAMAWPDAAGWPALRFAAGVASAVVFVFSSGWCLGRLAGLGKPALGGVMFAGPGAGIVASGLVATALVAVHQRAAVAWLVFAVLAFALTALVWRIFEAPADAPPHAAAGGIESDATGAPPPHGNGEVASLAIGYGLAGFGYIVTATFLPVIARASIPQSAWLDLFWPMFGAGVMAGALLATRLRRTGDLRLLLAGAYVIQAFGIGIGVVWSTEGGFAIGSLLLGLPFTALTFFAMQEVRRIRPHAAASTIGLLTALYGLGQIVGPPVAAALVARSASPAIGFDRALLVAASALLVGAAIFVAMSRRWPVTIRVR